MRMGFLFSISSTFLVLVQKRGCVETLSNCKSINLVGISLYKLLAKVLINRLKRAMSKVVNLAPNAFKGRQILDVFLITNEVVDLMQKMKLKVTNVS